MTAKGLFGRDLARAGFVEVVLLEDLGHAIDIDARGFLGHGVDGEGEQRDAQAGGARKAFHQVFLERVDSSIEVYPLVNSVVGTGACGEGGQAQVDAEAVGFGGVRIGPA